MPQFLIPPGSKTGDRVLLSREESHHLVKVLRHQVGDIIRLTDGMGSLFEGRIESPSSGGVVVCLQAVLPMATTRGRILLAQGLLKGEKMEFVIQKAAELGATEILPFTSSRTVAEWKREARKLTRWRKIAEAASKQSGRVHHLKVQEPVVFEKILETNAESKIIFWEGSNESATFPIGESVLILIGPEGGFSGQEVAAAKARGFAVLSMGSLILRAETAALAALSITQYELGNI